MVTNPGSFVEQLTVTSWLEYVHFNQVNLYARIISSGKGKVSLD